MIRIPLGDTLFPDIVGVLTQDNPPQTLVLGGGRSGRAAMTLLRNLGLQPRGYDDQAPLDSDFERTPTHLLDALPKNTPALLILSPGVPLNHPLCQLARENQVPVISEVELGLAFIHRDTIVLGVTGTNGKSTVVHATQALMASHLKADTNGLDGAVALGNIGLPVSEFVASGSQAKIIVVELSSYQLESMSRPVFTAAAITNLSSDHLARYKTIRSYLLAKWRIASLVLPRGALALGQDVVALALKEGLTIPGDPALHIVKPKNENGPDIRSDRLPLKGAFDMSLRMPVAPYWLNENDGHFSMVHLEPRPVFINHCLSDQNDLELSINLPNGEVTSIHISDPVIRGRHNAENLSFCFFFERQIFGDAPSLVKNVFETSTKTYVPLAHRQERLDLGSKSPYVVINDSKSTSFICTSMALRCFPHRVHLLIGGALKDDPVSDLLPQDTAIDFASVSCFGPRATWLAETIESLTGTKAQPFEKLEDATKHAVSLLQPGDTILLSPGAASFDSYSNFEERGEHFKKIIFSLLQTTSP